MPVEETKEQLQIYGMFRSCIYIFLIVELVMNLPITSDSRVTGFVLALIARFQVFNSVLSCKVIELICIFVTCVGTKAKKSLKFNVGLDARIGGFSLTADAFLDKRSDILTLDNSLMGYYGKQYSFSNIGKMTNKGFEVDLAYEGGCGNFGYRINGSVAYAHNTVDYMAADGFYGVDDFDDAGNLRAGLPLPAFGAVQPGDMKYLDLDKNGAVDQNDVTKIGRSWVPEWSFAFGGRLAWKGFDLECLFQGLAGVSANLLDNWDQTVAFVDNGNAYAIAKGAWAYYPTEGIDNRANATYLRLTTQGNSNNYRTSSLWIKDASFLKLRNLELGYTFQPKDADNDRVKALRCFVNGQNLFTFSPLLKEWGRDPENLSGGYPTLKSVNAGISITF